MTAWPHKGRLPDFAAAEPVASPFAAANDAGLAPEVEAVDRTQTGESGDNRPVEMPPADIALAVPAGRLRRRWLIPAAVLSGVAHAAAIYALVSWLDLRSVDADTEEVSIEIVVEPPETAGLASEQIDAATVERFVPPDPFAPELATAPAFPQRPEPVMNIAELPASSALAGPPPMPPVKSIQLPEPAALAVLAIPPAFNAQPPAAAPQPPDRPQVAPKQKPAERGVKSVPRPPEARKSVQPVRKLEKKTPDASARRPDKDRAQKPADKKRDAASSTRNAASGASGNGIGSKDRKSGEAGKAASAAAGGAAQYGALVNRHVQRYRRYPAEAAKAGIKGAVRVSIRIDSSGRLSGASVKASSGHAALDREALATVRRASPYPKPPPGVAPASFSLTLRFSR